MQRRKRKSVNSIKRFLWIFHLLLFIGALGKAYFDTNVFKVNRVQFRTKKVPVKTKVSILQITDLHNKVYPDQYEKLIMTVKHANADMIVLTGDFISRNTDDFTNVYVFMEKIKRAHPHVFFVTGNHELANENVGRFLSGVRDRGITILDNQNITFTKDNTVINVVGVDNASTDHENLSQAFAGIKDNQYTILLSHSPSIVDKYNRIQADLILSGHTHGGQIRLPIIGAVVGPERSLFPRWEKGIFDLGQGQFLYVDSGLGTSGYPVRFLNQSQISLIEIVGDGLGDS
ncbi:metallophosphoesterase [Ornithinibacillus sp. FSL M8-0202]|uniref:metallophosphoesterase n=1 Tax=Ornithinibacillus sp. FSL M8-0202 TaxID=2921616 RepID=UPI0030D42C01